MTLKRSPRPACRAACCFIRSLAGGISHCPAEETDTEAIAVAAEALTIALAELGDRTPEARPPRRVAPGGR